MVTVIDYKMGNLRSVEKAFQRLNQEVVLTSKKDEIMRAEKLVLPGVGNFLAGMKHLEEMDLIGTIKNKALVDKVPILGICLGMQLLTNHSEEGNAKGLELIDAETKRFDFKRDKLLKVPHIGWNTLNPTKDCRLLEGLTDHHKFYFVHSYYVRSNSENFRATTTNYGIEFDSIIIRDNIIGVQFHPEKSHDAGLHLLTNFLKYY